MTITIGLVANVFNEANALPGWIETHLPFFDDIRVLHAGPQGQWSNDGTLEILAKWNIPVEFCAIDEGFGVVRTKALRMSPCDWVMLLDADERFYHIHQTLNCSGASPENRDLILQGYDFSGVNLPNWENLKNLGAQLTVNQTGYQNQGQHLREIMEGPFDAICTVRRHWHDFSFRKPTQNWFSDPDWQLRTVRNKPGIGFDIHTRMHERLIGATNIFRADPVSGPHFDHFHFSFKRQEVEQRRHDVAIYNAIHEGKVPPKCPE